LADKYFQVDSRALLTLGRDSIRDHTTALIELVKNSYDADATEVLVEIRAASQNGQHYIRIVDDGCGMTEAEVDSHWLRIGNSPKRTRSHSGRGRRQTGEKGIGRISADRLALLQDSLTRGA